MHSSRTSVFQSVIFCSLALLSGGALTGCACDSAGPRRDDGGAPDADGNPDAARPDVGVPDTSLPDVNLPMTCADGIVVGTEACDDGNTVADDGCSPDCRSVDENYLCPVPGMPCVRVVFCGNGRIEGPETCDDRNTTPNDGCSATCRLEAGWICPTLGAACIAERCGDGIVAGVEVCDDGGMATPGCSTTCELEDGYECPTPNAACTATVCGNRRVEGTEECDDSNVAVGDGCDSLCKREPDCRDGDCLAVCGDAVRRGAEQCDDGNTRSGDGCSGDCAIEDGFTCREEPAPLPPSITLPITLRDFRGACASNVGPDRNGYLEQGEPGAMPPYGHPDFRCYQGGQLGIVADTLGADGRPRFNVSTVVTNAASFATWYRTDEEFNRAYAGTLELFRRGATGNLYEFFSRSFFPLTGRGLDTLLCGGTLCEDRVEDLNGTGLQNFLFTSEVHVWFEYAGNEVLTFAGDDDVWVFINGQLVVDIGGVHRALTRSIDIAACNHPNPVDNAASCISDLNLRVGGVYEAVVFQAERNPTASQYGLTLSNFNQAPSRCTSVCGDGVVTTVETCDQGGNNGMGDGSAYGGCSSSCTYEPYCGDRVVDTAFGEICDDGFNLGAGPSVCAPGCRSLGASCGDGVVQVNMNEQCDDGNNAGGDGCFMCEIEFG